MMENEQKKEPSADQGASDLNEEAEAIELLLFHVPECYVYLIPPRKSAASYRADEWNVNKWTWEGTLKVISKREECTIRLEDRTTGELYAQAFLREGELHPVESVIDSSRYFVLRIEENIDGRRRHAFIGIGFRERTEAYDFQAALHDHMKYLNKKKTAEEMEQHFQQSSSSVDYSLKDGETIVINLKNKGNSVMKSKSLEKGMRRVSLDETSNKREPALFIQPPPPPPASLSPSATSQNSPNSNPPSLTLEETTSTKDIHNSTKEESQTPENETEPDVPDDDFGDFQAAN
uniref:NECAP PHear domain-containing protein n=1 Tax=Kalanchoe fedtschenkoi TaxID=63787 RepID=A0A7N0VMM5_KALFE